MTPSIHEHRKALTKSENATKLSNEIEKMPFVIQFSRTAHTVGKIVLKHLKLIKENDFIGEHDFDIIMAYSKHNTIDNYLINSKT